MIIVLSVGWAACSSQMIQLCDYPHATLFYQKFAVVTNQYEVLAIFLSEFIMTEFLDCVKTSKLRRPYRRCCIDEYIIV